MQRCCANGIVLTLNAWACHADRLHVCAVEVACTVKFYLPAALRVVVNAVVVVMAIDTDGWQWLMQVSGCGMCWRADAEGISVKKILTTGCWWWTCACVQICCVCVHMLCMWTCGRRLI